MQHVVNIAAWLVVAGTGAGLAVWAGRTATALSRKPSRRRLLASARLPLGLLLGWSVAVVALVASGRYGYLGALGLAALVLGFFIFRKPTAGAEELLLEQEHQRQLRRYERLTAAYEKLLSQQPASGPGFLDEALLPAPREHLARALQAVYWPQVLELSAGRSSQKLLRRYTTLARFIKAEDAAFMNEFIGFIHNQDDVVAHIKQDPEHFILVRERMNLIHQQVNTEQSRLLEEWYRAGAAFDED